MPPRLFAVLVSFALVLASCGGDEATESQRDSDATADMTGFGQRMADLRRQAEGFVDGAPGILIGVRDGSDQKILAVGDASRRPERKLVPEDTVMIASVTKALVATAAMSLVEDGSIGLDDSVEKWLPGLLPMGRQIKVRDLLSMSSGLPDYEEVAGCRTTRIHRIFPVPVFCQLRRSSPLSPRSRCFSSRARRASCPTRTTRCSS